MAFLHAELAAGRWHALSLAEQMANIGSEVGRTRSWQDKDPALFRGAFERALELFDLTLQDPRWPKMRGRLKEIARLRELFCEAAAGNAKYGTTLEDLDRYFLVFAVAARGKIFSDSPRYRRDAVAGLPGRGKRGNGSRHAS